MIFVILGMDVYPFDRLAQAVDELERDKTCGEDFFLQLGASKYEPQHARYERFLSFGDVVENIHRASVVITHAGAGSTLVCLQQGKHPVLVPRLPKFGEIVDEHQLPFARKFGELGLATTVHEMSELPAAISAARGRSPGSGSAGGDARELVGWLEGFWNGLCAKRGG
ncbi:MAG: hypothetical protein IPJ19_18145 [Planctomycetes bacterium]|nr:hypothetical protein [Planctomycetota bacterium]